MTDHEEEEKEEQLVAILDAGAQYGKLIDRRVRELRVKSVLIPFNTPASELRRYSALIISGGPSSVYATDAPAYDAELFNLGIPILAICYGFQLMVHVLHGEISRGHEREDGQFTLDIQHTNSKLFRHLTSSIEVLLTHGDVVQEMPPHKDGFRVTAVSKNGIIAAGENEQRRIYGVQFHPEVDLTPDGTQMFRNFLFSVCGLQASFTLQNRMSRAMDYIRGKVGADQKVLCLVSGGVDSSVCLALLQKALQATNDDDKLGMDEDMDVGYQQVLDIAADCLQHLSGSHLHSHQSAPPQIFPVHIDHGFMRHDESRTVMQALRNIGIDNVHLCNAQQYFADGSTLIDGVRTRRLCETIKPEHKRKIIGDLFMRLCDKVVREELFAADSEVRFEDMLLMQGTLRPDLIESASKIANKGGTAEVIKTHHNDTELVRRLREAGKVIEPLTDYHKDEVRLIGETLGLPKELVWRQPFPGPGLAIRIICSDGSPYTTAHDDEIVHQLQQQEVQLKQQHIHCCLLGFQTVGVQGDGRTYAHCVGLTVGESVSRDNIVWSELYALAKRIPRQIRHVNRVIFMAGNALSGKQQTVTRTLLEIDVVEQLRRCDKIVNDVLHKYELITKLSQVPVILFPSNFGANASNARSVCVRTFITNDFMTGVPAQIGTHIPAKAVFEMFDAILKIEGIQRVAFDLTPKPPGTTEWE